MSEEGPVPLPKIAVAVEGRVRRRSSERASEQAASHFGLYLGVYCLYSLSLLPTPKSEHSIRVKRGDRRRHEILPGRGRGSVIL